MTDPANSHPATDASAPAGHSSIDSTTPVALITGATRGIGRAIAAELSRDHALVLGASSERSAQTLRQVFPHARILVADVADTEGLERAIQALGLEKLDVLVHNAGVAGHESLADAHPDSWQHLFRVNLFAVAEITRVLLPALRAVSGLVVAINSGAGHRAGAGYGPYAASKFALRAYTDTLREEERGKIRVTSVHPGKVDSDMQREIQALRGQEYVAEKFIRPESIARAVRLAVDTTPEAMAEEITVRPVAR